MQSGPGFRHVFGVLFVKQECTRLIKGKEGRAIFIGVVFSYTQCARLGQTDGTCCKVENTEQLVFELGFGVCSLRSAAIHDVFYNSLFTASELSTLKTWLVRSAKESVCKVIDDGPFVKRVVTRGAAKVDNTEQLVVVGFVERGL